MGVQAGPSQGLHVHVNVGRPGQEATSGPGAGASLTTRQIANVWARYAKYQLVIDVFLQDARVGSEWSQGLYFSPLDVVDVTQAGRAAAGGVKDAVSSTQARYSEAVFRKLHKWTKEHFGTADEQHFCNYVLSQGMTKKRKQNLEKALEMTPGSDELELKGPCQAKYPAIRYMSVNLAVLNKYGTLEFR